MYLNAFTSAWVTEEIGRLTLTWDVFKSIITIVFIFFSSRLTLTWDVFKSPNKKVNKMILSGLTLTWDVFK